MASTPRKAGLQQPSWQPADRAALYITLKQDFTRDNAIAQQGAYCAAISIRLSDRVKIARKAGNRFFRPCQSQRHQFDLRTGGVAHARFIFVISFTRLRQRAKGHGEQRLVCRGALVQLA